MVGLKRGPKPAPPEMQALMKARREEKNRIAMRARRAEKKRMKLEHALPDPSSAVARAGYGHISQGVVDQKRASLGGGAAKARGSVAEGLALCAMANSDVEPVGVPPMSEGILVKFQEAFASLALGSSNPVPSAASTALCGDAGRITKPCIALFGFSLPREHSEATYGDMIEIAKRSVHVPGHVRDRARIILLQEMGYDFCCVSLNREDQDTTKHYEGNFCNASRFIRGFKKFLDKTGMGDGNRPLQICVDWYWLPPGYDNNCLMQESFFRDTLSSIALNGLLRKDRDDGGDVPTGIVWAPYTLNVVKHVYKHKETIEKNYAICYVGLELLMKEHPMYKATASISVEDMAILGKEKDDGKISEWENVSSLGWAKQKVSAADGINPDGFEEYIKEVHSENTLMIKLQLMCTCI